MGDVLQYLIDGTSGIVTGGVDGKALVAGVCSKGIVGKAYLIGKRTDLAAMLGTGPLVDRVRDMLTTGGQAPYVVAVPVQGQPGGYISGLSVNGGKAGATSPVIRRSMPMWWSGWYGGHHWHRHAGNQHGRRQNVCGTRPLRHAEPHQLRGGTHGSYLIFPR